MRILTRALRLLACFIAPFVVELARAKEPPPGRDADMLAALVQVRAISMAVTIYADAHGDQMPPDMDSLRVHLDGNENAPPKGAPYVYIGRAGVSYSDLPSWEGLAVAHLDFDHGVQGNPTPENPSGSVVSVAYIDGHSEVMSRARAERVIAASSAAFKAAAEGTPFADHLQIAADLRLVIEAIHAYAKDHAGVLPPDLGATFSYVRVGKRTATPRQRAAIYLSPRAKSGTHIPDGPTPEWVNRNASYVYLGADGVALASVEDPMRTVLVHGKLDDSVTAVDFRTGAKSEVFGVASAAGNAEAVHRRCAEWVIPQSKKVVEFARRGAPLPDFQRAMRDLRLIDGAIRAYAKAHDDRLPPDLGATLEYLPADLAPESSPADRARLYLSPRARRATQPPDDADAAWVTAHTNYVYLGDPNVRLRDIRNEIIGLVYNPVAEPYAIMQDETELSVIPVALSLGQVQATPAEALDREINQWKSAVRDAAKKSP